MKRAGALVVAGFGVFAAGCTLGAGTFAGKACENNNDCPEPYACAQVRVGPRSCELLHGIDLGGGSGGGSGGGAGGGGGGVAVPPDYCHDVKPILDRTCVSNCHGVDHTGSGLLDRFDVYSLGGTPPAAYEMRQSIKDRVASGTMPPFGPSNPVPTSAEKTTIGRWVATGATECLDAGSSPGTDGGKADGGKADGG